MDMQFFLVAEKELLAELPSLYKAIVALIAVYYVFDIAYPTPCMNTLSFMERFLLGITNGTKLSKTLVGTISDIDKC